MRRALLFLIVIAYNLTDDFVVQSGSSNLAIFLDFDQENDGDYLYIYIRL